MRKMKYTVALLLAAVILVSPCSIADAAGKTTSKVVFNGITKNLTVKVKFRNASGTEKFYGHMFTLQRKDKGKWQKVSMKEGYAFDTVAITVPAKKTVKYSYPLKTYFEKKELRNGTYRLMTSYDVKKINRYVKFRIEA